MIVVHHLNNSRSQRILWLLEELGLPYEVKRYQRDAKTMLAPPALRALEKGGQYELLRRRLTCVSRRHRLPAIILPCRSPST